MGSAAPCQGMHYSHDVTVSVRHARNILVSTCLARLQGLIATMPWPSRCLRRCQDRADAHLNAATRAEAADALKPRALGDPFDATRPFGHCVGDDSTKSGQKSGANAVRRFVCSSNWLGRKSWRHRRRLSREHGRTQGSPDDRRDPLGTLNIGLPASINVGASARRRSPSPKHPFRNGTLALEFGPLLGDPPTYLRWATSGRNLPELTPGGIRASMPRRPRRPWSAAS